MEIRTIAAGGLAQAFAIQVLKGGHKIKLSNRTVPTASDKLSANFGHERRLPPSNEGTFVGTPPEGSGF